MQPRAGIIGKGDPGHCRVDTPGLQFGKKPVIELKTDSLPDVIRTYMNRHVNGKTIHSSTDAPTPVCMPRPAK